MSVFHSCVKFISLFDITDELRVKQPILCNNIIYLPADTKPSSMCDGGGGGGGAAAAAVGILAATCGARC